MKRPSSPADLKHLNDSEVMKYAADHDLDAFRILVEKYQSPVLNFFRKLGVYTDAEDLVQESFLRIYRNRNTYKPTAKFSTYLYTVARSVWIDWVRKQARQETKLTSYQEHLFTREPADGKLTAKELEVQEAVLHLPDKLRLVVVMSIYQGLKYTEISEILEIPLGTVKSRMSRAIDQLKESIHVRT